MKQGPRLSQNGEGSAVFFQSKTKRLQAKRQRIEDEIVGYIISRKQPPFHLMERASKIKLDLELRQSRRQIPTH